MKLEWSAVALADLDRFAEFLQDRHPQLAKTVAAEILAKTQVLAEHPQLGCLGAAQHEVFAPQTRDRSAVRFYSIEIS